MIYIPDPMELMDMRMEAQIDKIDKNGTYPCCICGRRFPAEDMHSISVDPSSSLECGMPDCKNYKKSEKKMKTKGFTVIEVVVVIIIIFVLGVVALPKILNSPSHREKMAEYKKAQVVSIDEEGNKLWRVWDNGRLIYYVLKVLCFDNMNKSHR